jgi:hypothetical protein
MESWSILLGSSKRGWVAMNVEMKVPIMAMKIVVRSPEARPAHPEAKSSLYCARVLRLNQRWLIR